MEGQVINNYFTPHAVARNRVEDFLRNNLGVAKPVINTFIMRLQAVLTATDNAYEMTIVKSTTDRKNETKISANELFFMTDIALLLGKEKAALGGSASALYSSPSPAFFSETGEAAALMTTFNGKLGLDDANRKRFYDFETSAFYHRPQNSYVAAGSGIVEQYPQFNWADVKVGLEPFEILSGQSDTKFTLKVGDGTRTAVAGLTSGGLTNIVNVFCFGFRVSDMAKTYDQYLLSNK